MALDPDTRLIVRSAVHGVLQSLPEVPDEVLHRTPERYSAALAEILGGYEIDLKELVVSFDKAPSDAMVAYSGIPFFSLCEHHLLPFFGNVAIGYIPDDKVIGLSKLNRLVEAYSRRLQIQERLAAQVADFLEENLKPKGVAVVVHSIFHSCVSMRGAKSSGNFVTSEMRGDFRNDSDTRSEFLRLVE